MPEEGADRAASILDDFATETGLTSAAAPVRYLWTDALAVCTWLGLHARSGRDRPLELAVALVDQVHAVLGRHRPDDPRSGWLSGLPEAEGARRPTAGGLRIGKELPERAPGSPSDPRSEWDRDGQYFHYLTRWIHALRRTWEVTGEARYLAWAAELARVAWRGFRWRRDETAPVRLRWKMSVDLTRPLVDAMGAHDPLDGLLACRSVQVAARVAGLEDAAGGLEPAVSELAEACAGRSWATDDPLGLGGLLLDLHGLCSLRRTEAETPSLRPERLSDDAGRSLEAWVRTGAPTLPAVHRLAFRELGLALGLRAVGRLACTAGELPGLPADTAADALAGRIETFWLDPANQRVSTWSDHRDINRVSLAASLVPEGWLGAGDGAARNPHR